MEDHIFGPLSFRDRVLNSRPDSNAFYVEGENLALYVQSISVSVLALWPLVLRLDLECSQQTPNVIIIIIII